MWQPPAPWVVRRLRSCSRYLPTPCIRSFAPPRSALFSPSSLRLNVAEALRETAQGSHVWELAKAKSIDAGRFACALHILRALALNHTFVEIAPSVFPHNTASSHLDTDKKAEGLRQSPGFTSSGELDKTAFNAAFIISLAGLAGAAGEGDIVGEGHEGDGSSQARRAPDAIFRGYDWEKLEKDAIVVDLGGIVGTQSKKVLKKPPGLKTIMQDQEPVIKAAEQVQRLEHRTTS
ncbi:unnamed protein product [Peniophora sp. CBMAI 1063]|nr:unnamed protein product [Peniophora sp. CBMAI 1063]